MVSKVDDVLFIRTGNSARSILAEGLLNEIGKGRFRGAATSRPTDLAARAGRSSPSPTDTMALREEVKDIGTR